MLWLLRVVFPQWIVIFYPGVFVFWLLMHTNIERLRRAGKKAYWVAALAWLITSGPSLFFHQEIFSVRWPTPAGFSAIFATFGIVALIFAVVYLSRAGKQISLRTMVGLPEIEPHKNNQAVLTAGVYSKTRNPIYFAHWLLVFAAAALADFAANWILFVLDCLILPLLIHVEERELLSRYGSDYKAYMRRVPRFFPQLR